MRTAKSFYLPRLIVVLRGRSCRAQNLELYAKDITEGIFDMHEIPKTSPSSGSPRKRIIHERNEVGSIGSNMGQEKERTETREQLLIVVV